MDAYVDSDIHAYERSQLPMVKYARWTLIGLAIVWGLVGLAVGIGGVGAGFAEAMPIEEQLGYVLGGLCTAMVVVVLGVLPAVAAIVGLGRGARWGWIVTIVVGALNIVPCCMCLPVGAFLLFAMLNDEIRQAFQDT